MLQLHSLAGSASLIVHIVLEELGLPFELVALDRGRQEHKTAEYLALNPNGLVPTLVDRRAGEPPLVLYETAAVCLHLTDTHPAARLMPPVGSKERALAYKWLSWLSTTVQSALIIYFHPERWSDEAAGAARIKAHAAAKVGAMLDQLDAEFARHGGPWLSGASFGLVDLYAFVLCRWTRGFERPARSLPHLAPWLDRVLARPAVQRAFAREGLGAPFV